MTLFLFLILGGFYARANDCIFINLNRRDYSGLIRFSKTVLRPFRWARRKRSYRRRELQAQRIRRENDAPALNNARARLKSER